MSQQKPVISVIGCGYVGLTLAAVLANAGYTVHAIEVNQKRLDAIRRGKSFFYEAGADPLIAAGVASGRLNPTNAYASAIPASDIVFSCVGTPDNPDGSSNLTYVFDAASQALASMKPGTIFVQKSTVPVGTGAKIKHLFDASNKAISYVSCPEFSRESTAIGDTLWFDRVVVGTDDRRAAERVLDLHRTIERARGAIARTAGLTQPKQASRAAYMTVGLSSAELIKVTSNAFLALKISFANSIAKLADAAGADISEVMDGAGSDHRIGRAFLNAGRGYGGGCFPKDVSGLVRAAEEYGVDMEIMRAATEVNESMPHYIINKAKQALGGRNEDDTFKGKRITVLGLSFKAGTSDIRRSSAIIIANTLAAQGAQVRAYDPEAMEEAKADLDSAVVLAASLDEAVKRTDCIFVATDWPEFVRMDVAAVMRTSGAKVFVDCMNRFDSTQIADAGAAYVGVGRC